MNNNQNDANDNTAINLQTMMFEQMKRLSDPTADLEKEIKRSNALSSAATVVINSVKVQIDAARVKTLQEKNSAQGKKQISNG